MSFISRVLPPSEWSKLVGTEAERLHPMLDAQKDRVVVVERDGEVLACTVLMSVLHAECVWIHPEHRGHAGVKRQLYAGVERAASEQGARVVCVVATLPVMKRFFRWIGARLIEGEHFVWVLKPQH